MYPKFVVYLKHTLFIVVQFGENSFFLVEFLSVFLLSLHQEALCQATISSLVTFHLSLAVESQPPEVPAQGQSAAWLGISIWSPCKSNPQGPQAPLIGHGIGTDYFSSHRSGRVQAGSFESKPYTITSTSFLIPAKLV